jgi:hypothetical protein
VLNFIRIGRKCEMGKICRRPLSKVWFSLSGVLQNPPALYSITRKKSVHFTVAATTLLHFFFLKKSCTEIYENPTNKLVPHTITLTDRQTDRGLFFHIVKNISKVGYPQKVKHKSVYLASRM